MNPLSDELAGVREVWQGKVEQAKRTETCKNLLRRRYRNPHGYLEWERCAAELSAVTDTLAQDFNALPWAPKILTALAAGFCLDQGPIYWLREFEGLSKTQHKEWKITMRYPVSGYTRKEAMKQSKGRPKLGRKEYKVKLTPEERCAIDIIALKCNRKANSGNGDQPSMSGFLQKIASGKLQILAPVTPE